MFMKRAFSATLLALCPAVVGPAFAHDTWMTPERGSVSPGTALTLGHSVAHSSGRVPSYVSHREGEVIGDHTVKFNGTGEFIELRHNALDRDIFVRGALEAAFRLKQKPAALYVFADLIFEV